MMNRIFWGIIFIVLGLWIWLGNFGIKVLAFRHSWPILLVLLGLWIILKPLRRKKIEKRKNVLTQLEKGEIDVEEAISEMKKKHH